MKIFSTARYVLPLPAGPRFPMQKYARLFEKVVRELGDEHSVSEPPAADNADLLRVHTPDWVARVAAGSLTREEIRRIGFPWSPEMVERSRRSAGATIAASSAALEHGTRGRGIASAAFASRGKAWPPGTGWCLAGSTR